MPLTATLIAGILAPFFVDFTPEVRSDYQSLGKLVEDRPMQVTNLRFGWDAAVFGRFGVRNWDVSSLTDRRGEVHRKALYHTEWGPTWQYDWRVADGWTIKSDVTRSWTLYRGFESASANKTYHWWQIDQSLENPYLVPFYRFRRSIRTSNYIYAKAGLRRRFSLTDDVFFTPSVFAEGGDGRNLTRVFGENVNRNGFHPGVGSLSMRLEVSWRFAEWLSAFAALEQYWVVGSDARETNAASTYPCAHNELTIGSVGLRTKF